MATQSVPLSTLLLILLFVTGHVSSEWEVLQADAPDQDDQMFDLSPHSDTKKQDGKRIQELPKIDSRLVGAESKNTVTKKATASKLEELNMASESEDIDCDDEININDLDCIFLREARAEMAADDANMSKAGHRVKREVMGFSSYKHRFRRQAVQDEGSGDGETFPETEGVTDGQYELSREMTFVTNTTDLTEEEIKSELERQLRAAFSNLEGYENVTVTNITIVDGEVKATWTLTVSGSGVGAYGANNEDVENNLQLQLLNVTVPLYNLIVIGDVNPSTPLDTSSLSNELATDLDDICSTNPCGTDFEGCVPNGYDEGVCVHKCTLFEKVQQCEHGGECLLVLDINGTKYAACNCADNYDGDHCQNLLSTDDYEPVDMDSGEITGVVLAALAITIAGVSCCFIIACRRRSGPVNMTYYGDDSSSSEAYTEPSFGNFVIDRPRISVTPIRSFSPHNYGTNTVREDANLS